MELAKQDLDAYAAVLLDIPANVLSLPETHLTGLEALQSVWADAYRHMRWSMDLAEQMQVIAGSGFPNWWASTGEMPPSAESTSQETVPYSKLPDMQDMLRQFGERDLPLAGEPSASKGLARPADMKAGQSKAEVQESEETSGQREGAEGGGPQSRGSSERAHGENFEEKDSGRENPRNEMGQEEAARTSFPHPPEEKSAPNRQVSFKGLGDLIGGWSDPIFSNQRTAEAKEAVEKPVEKRKPEKVAAFSPRENTGGQNPVQMPVEVNPSSAEHFPDSHLFTSDSLEFLPATPLTKDTNNNSTEQAPIQHQSPFAFLSSPFSTSDPDGTSISHSSPQGSQTPLPTPEYPNSPNESQAHPLNPVDHAFPPRSFGNPSPPPSNLQDVEDVIEELTRTLNRDYKRYYGH